MHPTLIDGSGDAKQSVRKQKPLNAEGCGSAVAFAVRRKWLNVVAVVCGAVACRRAAAWVWPTSAALAVAGLCSGCVNLSYPVGPASTASVAEAATRASIGASGIVAGKPPRQARHAYLLQPGDAFDVKFFYTQELNESLAIRPDGKISLQLVGELQAAGLEPGELERELRNRYGKVLRDPSVTVIVKQVSAQRVFVAGEVRSPGEVTLQSDMTALQAVSRAGFFTRDAETRSVVVLRYKGEEGPEFIMLDMKAMMDGRAESAGDVMLMPMDIVFVPQTQIAGVADFFGRYVSNIVPLWRNLGFSMIYYTNSAKVVQP